MHLDLAPAGAHRTLRPHRREVPRLARGARSPGSAAESPRQGRALCVRSMAQAHGLPQAWRSAPGQQSPGECHPPTCHRKKGLVILRHRPGRARQREPLFARRDGESQRRRATRLSLVAVRPAVLRQNRRGLRAAAALERGGSAPRHSFRISGFGSRKAERQEPRAAAQRSRAAKPEPARASGFRERLSGSSVIRAGVGGQHPAKILYDASRTGWPGENACKVRAIFRR